MARIALSGANSFGLPHSREYLQKLIATFATLAAHPRIGAERHTATQTVRLMPCDAHHILYIIQGDDVVILRVLHHLQDWFELL